MSDTIYRDEAIKALRLEYPMMPMFKSLREEWAIKTEGYRKAEEVIMNLPSADRQQGEWLIEKTCYDNYNYRCSYCDWYETHAYPDVEPYNFCPNCGSKMRGEHDD